VAPAFALPILPEFKGEVPRRQNLVLGAFVPKLKAQIAQEEVVIFAGAAEFSSGGRKDFVVAG